MRILDMSNAIFLDDDGNTQGFSRVLGKISLPIVEQYYVYCRLVLAFKRFKSIKVASIRKLAL